MWRKKTEEIPSGGAVGGEFEEAAARVMAEQAPASPGPVEETGEGDALVIRPSWADAAARLCFVPAARLAHPAYALTDEEAEVISPKMQAFLQAVADKYAPAAFSRVANKYPEFCDLTAALGILYWQKWRYVSKLKQMEAAERAEAERAAAAHPRGFPGEVQPPARPKVGERDEDGVLVI